MIQGNGLLATAFESDFSNNPEWLVFASGVSNSSETDTAAFRRERLLLTSALRESFRLVYFSCCALSNPPSGDNAYLSHKRAMELIVLKASSRNLVIRLPQVVGRTTNPNTLANFLASRIRAGLPFSVWAKAQRNLVDVDDVAAISRVMIRDASPRERIIAIAAQRSLPMAEIVHLFERAIGRKANCIFEEKGDPLQVDSGFCLSIAASVGIDLGDSYAERVIRKYYGY